MGAFESLVMRNHRHGFDASRKEAGVCSNRSTPRHGRMKYPVVSEFSVGSGVDNRDDSTRRNSGRVRLEKQTSSKQTKKFGGRTTAVVEA